MTTPKHIDMNRKTGTQAADIELKCINGHSDIRVTMRYAHFAPDHLEEAVRDNPLAQIAQKKDHKVSTQVPTGDN